MTLGRSGVLLADRYRLDRLVSDAGAVERWQAYDERLARPVTARLTPAAGDAAHEAAAQAALERLAQLNHPGVAAVYDVGTVEPSGTEDDFGNGALSYAISEWTDGRTLGEIMDKGIQPWPRVADWGRQISGALAALHSIGFAHGALGPNSIAIHDGRQVKILDAWLGPAEDEAEAQAEEGTRAGEGGGDAASEDDVASGEAGESGDDSAGALVAGDGSVEGTEGGELGEAALPVGAADDVYALGQLLWEAGVGAAPEFVERGIAEDGAAQGELERDGDGNGDRAGNGDGERDGDLDGVGNAAVVAGAGGEGLADARGLDLEPLRRTDAPPELAALLAEMLDTDPALRPTADVAQQRFGPFASTQRIGDTLPEIPVVTDRSATDGTVAIVPIPRVGRAQPTGLSERVGPAPGAVASAAVATLAAERERRRRRGLLAGLALLLAAIGTGVGLLVANLGTSHDATPGVDVTIPSGSAGAVTLPSGAAPQPSQSATSNRPEAPPPSHAPSHSPKPSATSSPRPSAGSPSPSASTVVTPSASASASVTTSSSPSSTAGAVGDPSTSPSAPTSSTATAQAQG